MIGLKSVAAIALALAQVAIAAARGALSPRYLASLSGSSWFLIGLVASLALGLIGVGWRFGIKSRSAIGFAHGRPTLVDDASPRTRELPPLLQRVLVLVGLAAIAIGALGNQAAARIVRLPEDLAEPSPSAYCLKHTDVATAVVAPPPKPVDQAGCALVRRAFQLGYAKSLGSCTPKLAAAAPVAPTATVETCKRRQLDEPYLHYAYRRLAASFGAIDSTSPIDVAEHHVADARAHFDHARDLLADVSQAITGSPHASHHLWIELPDPHPGTLRERFTGMPRCSTRFADLPLWPHWTADAASRVVEHVLGQLLFATRFGTAASCNDYTIHWDAPADACARLIRDPIGFLAAQGALASVRAVLDRRRSQLAIADLDRALGRQPAPPPPPTSAIVSLSCFSIGARKGAMPTGTSVSIDGESVTVRDLHVAAVKPTEDGPIDVYLALAALFAGTDLPGVVASHDDLGFDRFAFVRLDQLLDEDPFAGARWPLQRADLVEVYPFEHHLHAFVDAFRRRYLPQRGRL